MNISPVLTGNAVPNNNNHLNDITTTRRRRRRRRRRSRSRSNSNSRKGRNSHMIKHLESTSSNQNFVKTSETDTSEGEGVEVGRTIDEVKISNVIPNNLQFKGTTPSGKPRLFVCSVCTRAFARQEHLIRHERSHTNEKPYCCGICERKFSRRDLLLRHAHKIHNGDYGMHTIITSTGTIFKQIVDDNSNNTAPQTPTKRSCKITKKRAPPGLMRRRTSFSAQSAENYAKATDTHGRKYQKAIKGQTDADISIITDTTTPTSEEFINGKLTFDRVNFSTPELLPIDYFANSSVTAFPYFGSSKDESASFSIPDFKVMDTISWINDYPDFSSDPINTGNISPSNIEMKTPQFYVENSCDFSENSIVSQVYTAEASITATTDDSAVATQTLGSFTKNIQPVYSKFMQEEETQNMNHNDNDFNAHTKTFNDGMPKYKSLFEFNGTSDHLSEKYLEKLSIHKNVPPVDNYYTLYGLDQLSTSNISRASPLDRDSNNKFDFKDLPTIKLFTPELRSMCKKALSYYKSYCNHSGGSSSTNDTTPLSEELVLPSCNELNLYLALFQRYFLPHHSFIHPDVLNVDLQLLRKYIYQNENISEEEQGNDEERLHYANIVCLPLFMATFGSLYKSGCNTRSIELYEMSRRILHVYLETRKEQQKQGKTSKKNSHNVWLIQTLILSVVFALFADYSGKVDQEMVKRQISAVSSILKTNILFHVSSPQPGLQNDEKNADLPSQNTQDIKFNSDFDYIIYESTIRCILMTYKFCQFLKTFYHIESKLFLNESDIEPLCIPDDETTWEQVSLLQASISNSPKVKKYSVSFQKFYHSFVFNNIGMHPIPESLTAIMLYYEFNANTITTFHVFLNRIDTRKLELNLSQRYLMKANDPNTLTPCIDDENIGCSSSIMNWDSIILRNTLMCIIFFNKVDLSFGSKIWKSMVQEIYGTFLRSDSLNILTRGSYTLLTDFLVSLNFSIKNVTYLFKLKEQDRRIEIDSTKLSMYSLQNLYCNFLLILKFLLDFEETPNFKLLCIFTELKNLANKLLIPKFSSLYPSEFEKFHDVASTNQFLQNHPLQFTATQYSSINVDRLEKLINNVLVSSFNDVSFLNMTEQSTNEFPFSDNYPTYYPYASMPPPSLSQTSLSSMTGTNSRTFDTISTKSSLDLLKYHRDYQKSTRNHFPSHRQGFKERYHMSSKYVVTVKCFFKYVKQDFIHCHFVDRMASDFLILENLLDQESKEFK